MFLLKDSNSNLALSLVFSGIIIFNIINIEWVYQGFEEYEYITIRSLLIKVISLLLLLVFVRRKSDVVAYAFIICFGSIGNYVLNFINLKKYVKICFHNMVLKKHIAPIMTFFVSVIAIEIYSLLDVSMLTAMSNSMSVLIVLVVLPTITNNFDFNSTEWWNASKEQASQLLPNYWDELYPIMYYMIGAYLKRYDVVVNKLKNKRLIFGGALLGFSVINYFKNLGSAFVWNWATSYGGYQCLIIAVLFFCALLGIDTKNNKITFIIHSVAKYSFGMYLISWPIDIVVYKVMNVLMPQSAQMYLLPISIFCVSVCSYIGAIIVTKIADVLIQIAGFFAKSQKRMR